MQYCKFDGDTKICCSLFILPEIVFDASLLNRDQIDQQMWNTITSLLWFVYKSQTFATSVFVDKNSCP